MTAEPSPVDLRARVIEEIRVGGNEAKASYHKWWLAAAAGILLAAYLGWPARQPVELPRRVVGMASHAGAAARDCTRSARANRERCTGAGAAGGVPARIEPTIASIPALDGAARDRHRPARHRLDAASGARRRRAARQSRLWTSNRWCRRPRRQEVSDMLRRTLVGLGLVLVIGSSAVSAEPVIGGPGARGGRAGSRSGAGKGEREGSGRAGASGSRAREGAGAGAPRTGGGTAGQHPGGADDSRSARHRAAGEQDGGHRDGGPNGRASEDGRQCPDRKVRHSGRAGSTSMPVR